MSAYTPGPWLVGDIDDITVTLPPREIKEPDGRKWRAVSTIAHVNAPSTDDWSVTTQDKSGDRRHPEAKANACLISAAPDMYTALKALLDFPNLDASEADYNELIKDAEAAVRKAEGRK